MKAIYEISTRATLVALHSLKGFEEPHPHRFEFEFTLEGEPIEGRVVDFPVFEKSVQELMKPFHGKYLNDSALLSEDARRFPTSETLSRYFGEEFRLKILPILAASNPSVRLSAVSVTLRRPEGQDFGTAKFRYLSTVLVLGLMLFGCKTGSNRSDSLSAVGYRTPMSEHYGASKNFVISAQGPETVRIATEVYQRTKSLPDAMIAASFAISVERIQSTGLSGGGRVS